MDQKNGSYLLGTVGAFIGMLLAMVPFVIVYHLGYIVFWLGFLFIVLTSKGYDLAGGRQNGFKLLVVFLFSLLGIGLSVFVEDIWYLATEYVNEEYGLTYGAIPQVIWDTLQSDAEYRLGRLRDVGLCFFVMLLFFIGQIVRARKEAKKPAPYDLGAYSVGNAPAAPGYPQNQMLTETDGYPVNPVPESSIYPPVAAEEYTPVGEDEN